MRRLLVLFATPQIIKKIVTLDLMRINEEVDVAQCQLVILAVFVWKEELAFFFYPFIHVLLVLQHYMLSLPTIHYKT